MRNILPRYYAYFFLAAILLLCVLSMSSCSRKSSVSKTETLTVYRDSIHEKETVRLDTVIIPGDTLQTTFTIECDSATNKPKPAQHNSKSGRQQQNFSVDANGKAISTCIADSLLHVISAKDKELTIYKSQLQQKSKETAVLRDVFHIPKWAWYSLAANAILMLWTFRKPIGFLLKSILKATSNGVV